MYCRNDAITESHLFENGLIIQVYSCFGIHASQFSEAVLCDLKLPVVQQFVLARSQESLLPFLLSTACQNQTLHVSSGTVISISSAVADEESGIASCKIFLKSSENIDETFLVSQGPVDSKVEIDLSKYELGHNIRCIICLEAVNKTGLSSHVQAFLLVDDSPPVPGRVLEGITEIEVHCHDSTQVMFTNWTGFVDAETDVLFYQVAAKMAPNDDREPDLAEFGLPGHDLQAYVELQKAGLASLLRPGDKVFVSVKATNAAGLSSVASSAPLTIICSTQLCQCSNSVVCV
jgi:hypothetical protein